MKSTPGCMILNMEETKDSESFSQRFKRETSLTPDISTAMWKPGDDGVTSQSAKGNSYIHRVLYQIEVLYEMEGK